MSLVKFSEYLAEAVSIKDDEAIVEWTEEGWNSLTVSERAELEAEAVLGWAMWHIGPIDKDDAEDPEGDEDSGRFVAHEGTDAINAYLDTLNEDDLDEETALTEDEWLERYKPRNTQQRRATQKNKDRMKFKGRAQKLKAKIDRKKGGNKVKRIKLRKKWMRKNKSKIKNATKVYGGKVHSKYTKKK